MPLVEKVTDDAELFSSPTKRASRAPTDTETRNNPDAIRQLKKRKKEKEIKTS